MSLVAKVLSFEGRFQRSPYFSERRRRPSRNATPYVVAVT